MNTGSSGPGDEACAAALATLPRLGPRTLFRLLAGESPAGVWAALHDGRAPVASPSVDWAAVRAAIRATDVGAVGEAHRAAGIAVTWPGCATYPRHLEEDEAAPGVLFVLGDPMVLCDGPAVAIVGTRSATRYGLGVAAQLGAELAATAVPVVSGLALGIDGAAHEGACAGLAAAGEAGGTGGRPVGVVAGGLDRPYPVRHAGLWRRVADAGVIVSTSPIGTPLEPGRFPQRNRLLAALCDVAVVVESHHAGGSLSTALEAVDRGKPVGAVPGSIRSPASAGTNDLLHDGAFVVRDVTDVRVALGLSARRDVPRGGVPAPVGAVAAARATASPDAVGSSSSGGGVSAAAGGPPPGGADGAAVLLALGAERCSLDQLARRTGLALPRLCAALEALAAEGRLVGEGGWWEHG
jgi:DNA processing protein